MDQEKIDGILEILLKEAKRTRAAIPYSKEDAMAQAVILIGPHLEIETIPIGWRNEQEKYARMRIISDIAKELFCTAACLVSDTRWVHSDDIGPYLGIPPIAEIGVEAWSKQYGHILKEKYGEEVKNLPRHLWSEAVVVVMKGPRLNGPHFRAARYECGPNDTIRWLPTANEGVQHFNLLPDWWC
jgi:hypothetical protein